MLNARPAPAIPSAKSAPAPKQITRTSVQKIKRIAPQKITRPVIISRQVFNDFAPA